MQKTETQFTAGEFARLVSNFYNERNLAYNFEQINLSADLFNYVANNKERILDRKKVAFVWICLNPPYWQYAKNMIEGARQFFLPGHDVDYFLWSDMPVNDKDAIKQRLLQSSKPLEGVSQEDFMRELEGMAQGIHEIKDKATVFETEAVEWPMPTLMRYHLFLQQEEILSQFDYVFYCDVDMQFVNIVGDEILGNGLTAALHPGYAVDKKFWPPYEPNEKSTSFIPRPGQIIEDGGKQRFMPQYYAGGMQGGRSSDFIKAMKEMRKMIDQDMSNGYIPIWNDESAWNKYLFEHKPSVVLSPSYIYPDSLINEYYIPLWGQNYQPKLVTLTKKFTTSIEGGNAAQQMVKQMQGLKR